MKNVPHSPSTINTDEEGFPDTQIYHRVRRARVVSINGGAVPQHVIEDTPASPAPREPLPPSGEAMPDVNQGARRRKGLLGVLAVALLAGAGYGAHHVLVGSRFESTDNAYVQGNLVQITPQVGGTVMAISADDTDFVKAGQALVQLDPSDAQVSLDQAEAQLAQSVREVRALYASNGTLSAQIALRQADLERAKSEMDRAQEDVRRRAPLVATGAVGKEEFSHMNTRLAAARAAVSAAESALLAAREQLVSHQALTDGTSVAQHPNVQRAIAKVREAYLGLWRTQLLAPVDGYVAKRSVQVGQRVTAGAPMMSVVPLDQIWVDANFKESQLRQLRIGQSATLIADVYGKQVKYKGTVVGVGAGTGSAFSLLPAQNATGNWIKIVQRVPVRIAVDPAELKAHPLRVGLSMEAVIDVKQEPNAAAAAPRPQASAAVTGFESQQRLVEEAIKRIIDANLGHGQTPARAAATTAPAAAKR